MSEELEVIELGLDRICLYREDIKEQYKTRYSFVAQTHSKDYRLNADVDIALTEDDFLMSQKYRMISKLVINIYNQEKTNKFNLRVSPNADAYRVVYRVGRDDKRAIVLNKSVWFDESGEVKEVELISTTSSSGDPSSSNTFERYGYTNFGVSLYPNEIPDRRSLGYKLLDIREIYA